MKLFKTILAMLLTLAMLLPMAACQADPLPENTEEVESETATATGEEVNPDQIANTPMTDYSLKDLEDSLKLLGDRTAFNDEDELVVEWSGSGFEVDVLVNEEGSDLRLGVRCNYASRWSVFVDGVRWGEKITVTTGNKEQIIARAIPAGEHTIRLVKESQPNTSRNNYNNLHSFDFNGKVLDTTDTEDKELFFEFIGDGYFVGLGNAGTSKNASGNKILDETEFTKSLPYLVAQEFDSDYSVVAHSEIGLITQAGSFSIEALHGNQNAFRDLETYYEAERIPDVIFIHVGLDDTAEDLPAGEFIVQAELYVEGLRRLYGEDVPVVWLYNAMSVANRAHEITALEKKMGEGSGFYAFKCEFGNSGSSVRGSHQYPSAEEHQKSAELLIPFVKDILAK